MTELSLKELQSISFEIMKEVDAFCRINNIRYSLAYGTLLGAIRHKGFIPWDDDIDIYMPRPDYERFFSIFKSDDCLAVHENDSYIAFGRVCDIVKTKVRTTLPWVPKEDVGVWIDIFPIDGIGDDKAEFRQTILDMGTLLTKQLAARRAKSGLLSQTSPVIFLKQICRKVKYLFLDINKINLDIRELRLKYSFETANYCSQLVCGGNKDKEFFSKVIFEKYTEVLFESGKFMVVEDWDTILKQNFSDYMQLPPENERIQHSSDHTKFYWKE